MSDSVCGTCKHYFSAISGNTPHVACLCNVKFELGALVIADCTQHHPRQAQWGTAYRAPCEDETVDYRSPLPLGPSFSGLQECQHTVVTMTGINGGVCAECGVGISISEDTTP